MEKKQANFLVQVSIFSLIMIVAEGISFLCKPYPVPASMLGMVILFCLLCLKVVKLEQVESLGDSLVDKIGFLFVPSGISIVSYWDVMKHYGLQVSVIIFITTIVLLAGTGWFAQIILGKKSVAEIDQLRREELDELQHESQS